MTRRETASLQCQELIYLPLNNLCFLTLCHSRCSSVKLHQPMKNPWFCGNSSFTVIEVLARVWTCWLSEGLAYWFCSSRIKKGVWAWLCINPASSTGLFMCTRPRLCICVIGSHYIKSPKSTCWPLCEEASLAFQRQCQSQGSRCKQPCLVFVMLFYNVIVKLNMIP